MVTGIEPTTSGLLDQRRSRSDNQAPWVSHTKQNRSYAVTKMIR